MRDDLRGRGDVDLAAELQHRVSPVLADAQMPGQRRGFVPHEAISSSLLGATEAGRAPNGVACPASYLRSTAFEHARLTYVFALRPSSSVSPPCGEVRLKPASGDRFPLQGGAAAPRTGTPEETWHW
ncbi:hypothetical protein GCM10010293_43710 [Streptomyces griseoflavus]|nr:hypothetical protein GCM10010293_43710 [Streptomyces griseoflavus]